MPKRTVELTFKIFTFLFYPAHYPIHWLTTHFFTYPSFLYLKGLRHRLWLRVTILNIQEHLYPSVPFHLRSPHIDMYAASELFVRPDPLSAAEVLESGIYGTCRDSPEFHDSKVIMSLVGLFLFCSLNQYPTPRMPS